MFVRRFAFLIQYCYSFLLSSNSHPHRRQQLNVPLHHSHLNAFIPSSYSSSLQSFPTPTSPPWASSSLSLSNNVTSHPISFSLSISFILLSHGMDLSFKYDGLNFLRIFTWLPLHWDDVNDDADDDDDDAKMLPRMINYE